jgi:hypothetical protein
MENYFLLNKNSIWEITWAGDKTAYLVTDLTVTAMTVMKKRSGSLGQCQSRSNFSFFVLFLGTVMEKKIMK